jgi:quinol monooxygenase YgiN
MRSLMCAALALMALGLGLAPTAQAQDDSTAYMVSFIEVTPAARGSVTAMLRQLGDASRKEPGALRFEVLQRSSPTSHFLILEAWKDQAALDAHTAAAHTKQFRDKLQPQLLAPVDERLCITTAVGPITPAPKNAVYVVTHVDVGPPNRNAGIALLNSFIDGFRKEAGNLRFDAMQQKARTNHFEVVEVWKDQRADDAHEFTAPAKEYRTKLAPLMGARYDARWYKQL